MDKTREKPQENTEKQNAPHNDRNFALFLNTFSALTSSLRRSIRHLRSIVLLL